MSAVDVRLLVVDAEAAHGRVGRVVVEVRGADLRDLAPRSKLRGSDVVPLLAAVACQPDKAIVGASPECVDVLKRRSKRIHNSPLFIRAFGNEAIHAGWNSGILACEIVADDLPGVSAVGSFKEHVAGEIQSVRVER